MDVKDNDEKLSIPFVDNLQFTTELVYVDIQVYLCSDLCASIFVHKTLSTAFHQTVPHEIINLCTESLSGQVDGAKSVNIIWRSRFSNS